MALNERESQTLNPEFSIRAVDGTEREGDPNPKPSAVCRLSAALSERESAQWKGVGKRGIIIASTVLIKNLKEIRTPKARLGSPNTLSPMANKAASMFLNRNRLVYTLNHKP
jgi:hypothetical protein